MPKDKKEAKRLYDIEYRRKNKELLKAKKARDYKANVEHYRKKETERRSKPENKKAHNEYCMRPEYVKQKRIWDIVYRSMRNYGEFWEAAVLINQLEIETRKRIPRNERLSTRRCVNTNNERNKKRRLDIAIHKIITGNDVSLKNWGEKNREILKEILVL